MPTDWINGLIGGLLIGLGSAVLLLGNGRIAGAAGIFRGLLTGRPHDARGERVWFVLGLIVAPIIYAIAGGQTPFTAQASLPVALLGGAVVGVGVRLGNGCTSGHGVCGLSRFSERSLAAVAVFMVVCAATVFVTRHVAGG